MGNNITFFACLLVSLQLAQPQTFTLNLTQSLLVLPNTTINTILVDYEYCFLVAFANGQVRRYTSDFSSYLELSFPEPIENLIGRGYVTSTTLSNTSSLSLNGRVLISTSKNLTTIRDYNYYSYNNQYSYTANSTILNELGFPLTISNRTRTFHALLTPDAILIVYLGNLTNRLTWASIFGGSTTCIASMYYSYPMTIGGDNITASFYYYVSLSNNRVYLLLVRLRFTFDFAIDHYALTSFTYGYSSIYLSPSPITYLKAANGLLMMQSNTTGITTIYNVTNSSLGTTSNLPLNQTMNFFYVYNTYYLLQSSGLYRLNYNSTNFNLSLASTLTVLPEDKYAISFGSSFYLVYTPGKGLIYKGGVCTGQSFASGSTCVYYNCSVNNCSYCFITPSICTICKEGYVLNPNTYTCTPNPEQMELNSLSLFEPALAYSVDLLSQLISIPAARRVISPFFVYFGIFDDLYIYQFHDRVYGETLNDLFSSINGIENKKWSLLNYRKVLALLNSDSIEFTQLIYYQDAYDYYQFKDEEHADVGSEGLWGNCQNYFIVTIPVTLLGFILFRLLFKLLYNYPVSKMVRKFDFWPFVLVILLQGNIQQLAFYLVTDWKNMFTLGIGSKWLKVYSIFFGFAVVLLSTSLYFISYHLYARLNNYLTDNNRNDILGIAMLICQGGFKNLTLGILHSVLRVLQYYQMLSIILTCEVLFNAILVVCISKGVYRLSVKMWIFFLLNLIKVVLILTLFVDYNNINIPLIETVQQFLIFIEVLLFALGVFHQTILTLTELFSLAKQIFFNGKREVRKKGSKCLKQELSRKGVLVYVTNLEGKKEETVPKIVINEVGKPALAVQEQKCKKFKANKSAPKFAPNLGVPSNGHRISFNIKYVTRKLSTILHKT